MGGILQVDTIQNNNATTLITQTNSTTLTFGVTGQNIVIPSGVTFNTASATVTLPSTITATTINATTLNSSTLNVTTTVLAAGAVGTPSLTTSGDTNTGIFFPSADTIAFTEGGTEAMRIDSGGSLRIGTTGTLLSSEKVTIQAGAAGGYAISAATATTGGFSVIILQNDDGNATRNQIIFRHGASQVGSVTSTASATVYNTSSDYRLKENVNYNFDATTRLKQLKPARFNFIVEPNKTVDGFLAHEVFDIIPEAITGTKDETKTKEKVVVNNIGQVIAENIEQADWESGKIPNEEGKSQYPIDSTWEASKEVPVHQGIDQSKLTPILTKALQEAIARIEQLEARLTVLENN